MGYNNRIRFSGNKIEPRHTKRFLWEFIPELGMALTHQLHIDRHKFGDSWRINQNWEATIFRNISFYYTEYLENGKAIPWLKVIGTALIGWIHSVYQVDPEQPE